MNKVLLLGNLGRDPELRNTNGGTTVCNFSLAINERKKIGGEWQDHTEWVNVVVFGKTAENCNQYLAKGRQALVEGRLQTRKWEKDGVTRYSTEVIADRVQFVGGGERREQSSEKLPAPPKPSPYQVQDEAQLGFQDDDIPF